MPTKQNPAVSGFGPATTAKETLHDVDLTGKVAIVTGGYAGIGLETTRALAGARTVIVPVRALDDPNFENRLYDRFRRTRTVKNRKYLAHRQL